ncbi:hypothetical protein CBP12_11235 [Oceanisphaera avium]|uniref:TPM domain-containing protein n=2 Tax=Oceanisphaera avium TaxID=1903694 RepID=A0A1Y0D0T4_9GAMM|nr:hypothetical protein CBP12_11235 [Oceanisphaera avium]
MRSNIKQLMGLAAMHGHWLRRRHFNEAMLAKIAEHIRQGETEHTGELVVAVEATMPSHEADPELRALEVYGRLKVWDTPFNSGVLLYLALDRRAIEIVADRGITASSAQWQRVCENLQESLAKGHYQHGVLAAIDTIQAILKAQAPFGDHHQDSLANAPVIL